MKLEFTTVDFRSPRPTSPLLLRKGLAGRGQLLVVTPLESFICSRAPVCSNSNSGPSEQKYKFHKRNLDM